MWIVCLKAESSKNQLQCDSRVDGIVKFRLEPVVPAGFATSWQREREIGCVCACACKCVCATRGLSTPNLVDSNVLCNFQNTSLTVSDREMPKTLRPRVSKDWPIFWPIVEENPTPWVRSPPNYSLNLWEKKNFTWSFAKFNFSSSDAVLPKKCCVPVFKWKIFWCLIFFLPRYKKL